jgi:hypothetical protein
MRRMMVGNHLRRTPRHVPAPVEPSHMDRYKVATSEVSSGPVNGGSFMESARMESESGRV